MRHTLYFAHYPTLEAAFAAIPADVTTLDLSQNNLIYKTAGELIQIWHAIPASVTTLHLDRNGLNYKRAEELAEMLTPIPKTVKIINLNRNHLFSGKTAPEIDDILLTLGDTRVRLELRENGESERARFIAPLASMLSGSKFLDTNTVAHIGAF
jgi:hypothetical protein